MKRLLTVLALMVLLLGVASADVDRQRLTGPVKIPTDEKTALRLPLNGKLLAGNVKLFSTGEGGLVGGRDIHIQADFINNSTASASYSMGVGFFDAAGNMLAATGKTEIFSVGAGKSGSCGLEISLPRAEFYKIASWQFVFYNDGQTIGKN